MIWFWHVVTALYHHRYPLASTQKYPFVVVELLKFSPLLSTYAVYGETMNEMLLPEELLSVRLPVEV